MVVSSVDISQFIIDINVDLSGATPQICLDPASIGAGQAGVKYIYKITSPSGIIIHNGDATFATPDAVGNGDDVCYNLPLFNGSIEWSGGDYIVVATMQDSEDKEWSYTTTIQICPPNGNKISGSWFGKACISVEVKCDSAEILLHDTTNYDYKGKTKTLVSKTLSLIYPADPVTGITPSPTVITGFNDVAIPITYNGNYEARLVTIYEYDLGDNVTLTIAYTTFQKTLGIHHPIAVECYIDLCPLLCEFTELLDATEKLCGKDDIAYVENQNLIQLINGKILTVLMNKQCGKPVGNLIAEIKRISGFKCNCDCGNNGVVPRSLIPVSAGSYVFDCVTSCGDVAGVFSNPSGNNILLTLNDVQYVFALSVGAGTAGFSVSNDTAGCIKTYTLDVNLGTLSNEIMTTINGDADLLAQFCALVGTCDPINIFAGVDLKCITPALSSQCDYFGSLNNGQTPMDTIYSITVNGVDYFPPTSPTYTNAAAINAWLGTLGFGFGATDYVVSGVGVTLTTLANENAITKITFQNISTLNLYSINVVASNCDTVTTTDKMQAVVDTICNIYNALYGVSSVLYKVRASDGTTPGFLDEVLTSPDNSVQINVNGNDIELTSILKTVANDNCGGALVDKFTSNYLTLSVVNVNTYASDYVITTPNSSASYRLSSVKINGTTYSINVLTNNLAGIETALNALGLGTFTATSPASNLVLTSLGNKYTVTNAIIETLAGPVFTTYNAVVSNTVLLGACAKISVEPLTRTWTDLTIDGTLWDAPNSQVEYATIDSTRNTMLNVNLVPLLGFTAGSFTVNPTDPIPVASRPRTEQKIKFEEGWDGVSANAANFIIVQTNGLIVIEINLNTSNTMRFDSIYYPAGNS